MRLGFVFTNYNNSHYTREAVKSLSLINNQAPVEGVVVDNKSNDEDVVKLKEIEQDFAFVHLILNDDNIGYFRGLNVGIQYLRNKDKGIEYIIIGNNDLEFPSDFYQKMLDKKQIFDQYAVVSPNIITLDGIHQNPHVIERIGKVREFIYDVYYFNFYCSLAINYLAKVTRKFSDRKDEEQHDVAQTIYQGYGACYILGPLFFQNFDQLWAPTFLMGEEFFLSKQLSDKQLKLYYEPSIVIRHHEHATISKLPSKKFWAISRDAHKVYRKYVGVFN